MEKSCANHPESMALASCKACDKSVCLMCVVDEKEGTFCSAACHTAFVNGESVAKFEVPQPEPAGVQKLESIFEPDAPSSSLPLPPNEPEPIVSEGTKWRPIGASCEGHPDTPAVANCDRCGKPVCPLCLMEAAAGTFCSNECHEATQGPPPQEAAAIARKPAPVVERPKARSKRRSKGGAGKLVAVLLVLLLLMGGGLFAWKSTDPKGCADFLRQVKLDPVADWVEAGLQKPLPPLPPVAISNPVKPPVKPDPVKPDPVKSDPVKPDPVKPPVKPDPVKPDPVKPDPVKPDPVKTDRNPPPVKPVVAKPEPIRPTRLINPWVGEDPGTWFRIRTENGAQVTYTDVGLKDRGQGTYTLLSQSSTKGQAGPVNEEKHDVAAVVLLGEETFTFDDRSYLCEIRQPRGQSDRKYWSLLQGKSMGAVIKSETPEGKLTAGRVWDHSVRVKNRVYDCLVVEAQIERGAGKGWSKTWYTASIPMGFIKQETDQGSMTVVDQGVTWSSRPPFPQ